MKREHVERSVRFMRLDDLDCFVELLGQHTEANPEMPVEVELTRKLPSGLVAFVHNALDRFARHLQVEAALLGVEPDLYDALRVARKLRLHVVAIVLRGRKHRPEEGDNGSEPAG